MQVGLKIEGQDVCTIEIWDDKVPRFIERLREQLPLTSVLQHGKIVGDMAFFVTPIVSAWENVFLTEEVGRMRREEIGRVRGAVCFYAPRQMFCMVYGDDVADENLKIDYVGEVVSGALELELAGTQCWLEQGRRVELVEL